MAKTHPDRAAARRRLLFVGVAAASSVAVASLWFLVLRPQAPVEPAAAGATPPSVAPRRHPSAAFASREEESADIVEEPSPPARPEPPQNAAALPPDEVLGNLECGMRAGWGAADDLAAVVLPHETGARFSVMDGNGAVVGDTLPFMPNHYKLGRQEDGTPLIGLADLRLNSKTFRPMDSPEPLRIYLGEHVIYETDKAWNFLVAPDASSYVVHEPLGSEASRLVVRNLERGTEQHIDLGTRMTSTNAYEGGPSISYALDGTEVKMYQPESSDAMGNGTYRFYPVGDGRTRRLILKDVWGGMIVSSREGYIAEAPEDLKPDEHGKVWRIAKRRFDYASGTTKDVWSRRLDLTGFNGRLSVSDNGKWLGVHGWNFRVLNTENGRTVFRYPTVGHEEEQLARLVNVVGADASAADLGRLGGISFKGDRMRFYRTFGRAGCSTPPGEEYDALRYRKCVRARREIGSYKTVLDVYDMKTITLDAPASFRFDVYPETNCMEGNALLGGLQDDKGTLVYSRGIL